MIHELRLFFIALQFFTRVPVPAWVGFEPAWLNQSARYFPLVGACVGLVGAGMLWTGSWVFPPAVAVGLSMASTLVMTGGFHEDGLADTFDALGGSVSRERALEIMKDSRIGSYGALALVVVLGTKAATLASLPLAFALPGLVFAHTASRAAATTLIFALPYAGDVAHAKAKPLAQRISGAGLAAAWVSTALVGAVLGWAFAMPVAWAACGVLVALVAAAGCGAWLHRRLQGYTGDGLGAAQQLSELFVLLGALAMVGAR